MIAWNETEIFETEEERVCIDADGNIYEMCWRCEQYFPQHELIVSNINGVFCEECDEIMLFDDSEMENCYKF